MFFKKLRHELYYVKKEDFIQIIIFIIAIVPSLLYYVYVHLTGKRVWLICEDRLEARDNGYCFFKYINSREDNTIEAYYAIDYKSQDYKKVASIGNTVRYGGIKHWILYLSSEYNISSQKSGRPGVAVGYVLEQLKIIKEKNVFLQHGITLSKAEWLFYKNTKMKLFICGAKPEYDYVKEFFGYPDNNVKYLGFCRFDDYFTCEKKYNQIVLMPSWREWIGSKNEYSKIYENTKDFKSTQYFEKYQSLINNKKLIKFLNENGITMFFYPHRDMQKFISAFSCDSRRIKIVSNQNIDIRELLMQSALMITDYSSVALDFAYMEKPVIYYQFDEKRFREAQYRKGYFDYRTANLGVVYIEENDVVDKIISLYKNDLRLPNKFYEAHKKFFPIYDDKNCERTFQVLYEREKQ